LEAFLLDIKKLEGMKVITSQAYTLGEVKGFEINTQTWDITHLYVKLTEEAATQLGFKKRFRSSTVCMAVGLVKAVGEYVTIDKSLTEIEDSPDISACKKN
jgi:sporulation protein YlmC with PRC-barrel domain